MHKTEFEDMWDDSVFPLIQKCDSQLDMDYKSAVSMKIKDLDKYKADLRKLYLHKREWLKREYLPYDKIPKLDFHKLSAVLCRCIIGNKPFVFNKEIAEQFLRQSHYRRKQDEQGYEILRYQIDNIYVNYKLAFLVGESVAFDDLTQWAQRQIQNIEKTIESTKQNSDLDCLQSQDKLDDLQKKIQVYRLFIQKLDDIGILADYEWANRKHDPFYESMINCLMKNDILNRDFDYLLFAANMYQWQEYTKLSLFGDIMADENYSSLSLPDIIKGQNGG